MVEVVIRGRVLADVAARALPRTDNELAWVAARDFGRLYGLLSAELRAVTRTEGEAHLVVAAMVALRTARVERRRRPPLADAGTVPSTAKAGRRGCCARSGWCGTAEAPSLRPYPAELMDGYPVASLVSSVPNDGLELVWPLTSA